MSAVDPSFAAFNYVPPDLVAQQGQDGDKDLVPEARPTYPMRKVAIAGHSYAGRFQLEKRLYQPGNLIVRRFAKPGGTIDRFRASGAWEALVNWKPDFTFLILGGNDITDGLDVHQLVGRLADVVLEVERETGGRCHIVGIECRDNPRNISPHDFKKVKNAVNKSLRRVYRIKGRYTPMQFYHEYLSWDGVHLDNRGSTKLLQHLLREVRRYYDIVSETP